MRLLLCLLLLSPLCQAAPLRLMLQPSAQQLQFSYRFDLAGYPQQLSFSLDNSRLNAHFRQFRALKPALLQQYRLQHAKLPDAITFVPMHPAKQRKRGFNPAQLLAEHAAQLLQIPLLPLLQRQQPNKAQVGLNRKQRLKNLHSAFTLADTAIVPASIALVDDVITTGATADALCQLLRRAGARHISLWTIAVTLAD